MRCRLYVYCPRLPSNSGHVLRQLRRVPLFRLASGQPCSPIDAANMALTCSLHLQFMKCFRLERILQFSIAWTALSWGMPCLIRAEWCRTLLPIYRCTHARTHTFTPPLPRREFYLVSVMFFFNSLYFPIQRCGCVLAWGHTSTHIAHQKPTQVHTQLVPLHTSPYAARTTPAVPAP